MSKSQKAITSCGKNLNVSTYTEEFLRTLLFSIKSKNLDSGKRFFFIEIKTFQEKVKNQKTEILAFSVSHNFQVKIFFSHNPFNPLNQPTSRTWEGSFRENEERIQKRSKMPPDRLFRGMYGENVLR